MIALSEEIRRSLAQYFAQRSDVDLAYLFGSQARGTAYPESDVDVAVALNGEPDAVLGTMVEIEDELKGMLPGKQIDVVILDHAGLRLRHEVIATGSLLFERDTDERVDFEVKSQMQYFDWQPVERQFDEAAFAWARGESCGMIIARDGEMLSRLRTTIGNLESKQTVSLEDCLSNWETRDIVERELEKAAQCCIDIGARLISVRGWRRASDNHGVFDVLTENQVIDSELARRTKQLVGLRNVLAHEYRSIGNDEVHRLLLACSPVLREFAACVAEYCSSDS